MYTPPARLLMISGVISFAGSIGALGVGKRKCDAYSGVAGLGGAAGADFGDGL